MSKYMYDDKYYGYTPAATALDMEAIKLIEPLFKKYLDIGHSPREISQIISVAVNMLECETLLRRNSKIVKEIRAEKDNR